MKTFLCNYTLSISYYMGKDLTENKMMLVEAENEDKAKETLMKYWENRTSEYDVYYYVCDCDVTPTISQKDILK